jgi:8-oxo-dGTP diphosphatase
VTPRVRVGVGIVIERDGMVLLGLRKSSHGENTWAFPGGHLEYGETPEQCAAREAMEEVGVTLENFRRLAFTNDIFEVSGKHYITLFIKSALPAGQEPRNMEPEKCGGWHWFSPDALPQPLMLTIVNLLKDGHRLTDAPVSKAA